MRFQRKSDGVRAEARQWFRHGDHPAVQPATADLLPGLQSPQKVGMLDGDSGRIAVLAGDWIVSLATGAVICLPERVFRRAFEVVEGQ